MNIDEFLEHPDRNKMNTIDYRLIMELEAQLKLADDEVTRRGENYNKVMEQLEEAHELLESADVYVDNWIRDNPSCSNYAQELSNKIQEYFKRYAREEKLSSEVNNG